MPGAKRMEYKWVSGLFRTERCRQYLADYQITKYCAQTHPETEDKLKF